MTFANKFLTIVVVSLFVIILLQRSCTEGDNVNNPSEPIVITKTEVAYKTKDTVIYRNVPVYISIPFSGPIPPEYIPSKDYDSLKNQFKNLVAKHTAKNVYKDSIAIDTIGKVVITDTIQFNKLSKRKFDFSYKIPIVTKTITVLAPPRRQVYIGGALTASDLLNINAASAGILYKNRKDQIYTLNANIDFNGNISYSAGAYWKIKLFK